MVDLTPNSWRSDEKSYFWILRTLIATIHVWSTMDLPSSQIRIRGYDYDQRLVGDYTATPPLLALFILAAPSYEYQALLQQKTGHYASYKRNIETSYGESPTAPALVFSFGFSHLFWLSKQATSSRCIGDILAFDSVAPS
eukprot:scaffold501474_cov36-Prasinocladus_malaysianus.AAC.1